MERIAIKLGGSLITDKKSPTPKANLETIQRILQEVADSGVTPLIIVNGAGSYGHPFAKAYLEGRLDDPQLVHDKVRELNQIVVTYGKQYGLVLENTSPFFTCVEENGKVNMNILLSKAEEISKKRHIISTHGDMIPTDKSTLRVLSGDTLTIELAKRFHATKIVMITSVDGVLDKNKRVVSSLTTVDTIPSLSEESTIDVSGGMQGKVKRLQQAAKEGIPCYIVGGSIPGNVRRFLEGKEYVGTEIVPEGHAISSRDANDHRLSR